MQGWEQTLGPCVAARLMGWDGWEGRDGKDGGMMDGSVGWDGWEGADPQVSLLSFLVLSSFLPLPFHFSSWIYVANSSD